MKPTPLSLHIIEAIESIKANNLVEIEVSQLTDVTDKLIIASGTSSRHVKSIANHLIAEMKKQHIQPVGVEGQDSGEWILVDFGDIVVHIMLPEAREFYAIEQLWALPKQEKNKG